MAVSLRGLEHEGVARTEAEDRAPQQLAFAPLVDLSLRDYLPRESGGGRYLGKIVAWVMVLRCKSTKSDFECSANDLVSAPNMILAAGYRCKEIASPSLSRRRQNRQ